MLGDIFALLAAASNGTIGVFSRYGFNSQGHYISIAFFRCVGALLILFPVVMLRPRLRREFLDRRKFARELATLSFFGIFLLYFFETWAFSKTSIPVVSFLTYASGVIAVLLGVAVLKETLNLSKIVAVVLVFLGIYLMFDGLGEIKQGYEGAILALIGGSAYSVFLFLWRKFNVPSGLATLTWFFGFGMVFLGVPFLWHGASLPAVETIPSIAALVIIPTVGGYYFTGRALSLSEASRVQVIETSDPLFSSLFAFVLFGDVLSVRGTWGAVAIFLGLCTLVLAPLFRRKVG